MEVLLAALAALLLVGGYLLGSWRARRLEGQRERALEDVGLLQRALLPPVPQTVGTVQTSVAYRPSDGPGAGGDFYDALVLPDDRAAFILGDVSGHGRTALARTAFMRFTLRAYLEAGLGPRETLQVAGPVIGQHLGGDFATAVIAIHDPAAGTLVYACAGHPAPIVVGPERVEPVLVASSPPIGLDLRTGLRETMVPLRPGAVICLYTDGIAEARKGSRILGRPRLGDIVERLGPTDGAADLIARVTEEVRLVSDDMAAVLLRPAVAPTGGGPRREQLEVVADEIEEGLAGRFLEACGIADPAWAVAAADRLTREHGTAVLDVRNGPLRASVDVLPGNVASIEASQAPVARAR